MQYNLKITPDMKIERYQQQVDYCQKHEAWRKDKIEELKAKIQELKVKNG